MSSDERDLVGSETEAAHGTLVDPGIRFVGAEELAREDDVPGEIGVFRLEKDIRHVVGGLGAHHVNEEPDVTVAEGADNAL